LAEIENAMRYGISAGINIINDQDQILLVNHLEKDKFDFPKPGGN
jgi:hypothetical protein